MNADIQAAVAFAERLGIDADSDFNRHHPCRRLPCRIIKIQIMRQLLPKTFLDSQTCAHVRKNCKETIRPLIDALHPAKEIRPLQTFKDLGEFFPQE